jgi:hypothetical protein
VGEPLDTEHMRKIAEHAALDFVLVIPAAHLIVTGAASVGMEQSAEGHNGNSVALAALARDTQGEGTMPGEMVWRVQSVLEAGGLTSDRALGLAKCVIAVLREPTDAMLDSTRSLLGHPCNNEAEARTLAAEIWRVMASEML